MTERLLAPFYAPGIAAFPGSPATWRAPVVGRSPPRSASRSAISSASCGRDTPEYRGRGYGAAVTARAVIDGFANGAELALLAASPMGEPVYRRLGFREVLRYVLFRRPG